MTINQTLSLVVALCCLSAGSTRAQNVQRQSYTMSAAMHEELDKRQFDSARVEKIVAGISDAFFANDIVPILDASSSEVRITADGTNKVLTKKDIATLKNRLLRDPALAQAVADESRFILTSESIGINSGEFWISEICLDAKCDQKKTSIVTINLP